MQLDQLRTPWVIDDTFYTHLTENPLHAAAFARELRRHGRLIKLEYLAGPKPIDKNFRFVVRYIGTFPASNVMVADQVWTIRTNKAHSHPLWRIVHIYRIVCCVPLLALLVLMAKGKIPHSGLSVILGIMVALSISVGLLWAVARCFVGKDVRE